MSGTVPVRGVPKQLSAPTFQLYRTLVPCCRRVSFSRHGVLICVFGLVCCLFVFRLTCWCNKTQLREVTCYAYVFQAFFISVFQWCVFCPVYFLIFTLLDLYDDVSNVKGGFTRIHSLKSDMNLNTLTLDQIMANSASAMSSPTSLYTHISPISTTLILPGEVSIMPSPTTTAHPNPTPPSSCHSTWGPPHLEDTSNLDHF